MNVRMKPLPPPKSIPKSGIPLGYSLEHEHQKAPMGFCYSPEAGTENKTELEAILHTGSGHLMTIAPTGSGKGVSCIIPTLLHYDGTVIVVDPKGENYAVTAKHRAHMMGNEVILFDPFALTGDKSHQFNPIKLLRELPESERTDFARELTALIIPDNSDFKDPFWVDMARTLLTGYLIYISDESYPAALSTFEALRLLCTEPLDSCRINAKLMKDCNNRVVQESADIILSAYDKTLASIRSVLQSFVSKLSGSALDGHLCGNDLNPDEFIEGKLKAIYLVLPPEKLHTHSNLLRLWVGCLINFILKRRGHVEKNTLFILDEAAQLGSLEELRQAITLLRGYGLQTWSFWQDLSQLQRLYPDWKTLMNNCRVQQVFGITNLMMANELANIHKLWTAEELLELDSDEMILQIAGDLPVIAQKLNYLTDPAFENKARPNPFHLKSDVPYKPRFRQREYSRVQRRKRRQSQVDDSELRVPSFNDFIEGS